MNYGTLKFTKEQLQAIYNGDMNARNTFYFDNLEILQRMAHSAIQRERNRVVLADDLVQGVYVDMDYFCDGVNSPVKDLGSLVGFIYWSFHLAPYGGLAYCRENNPKLTGKRGSFFDKTYTDNNLLRLDATIDDSDKHLQSEGTATLADYIPDPRAEQLLENKPDCTEQYVNTFGEYLTPKQRDVFARIMDGYTDTQIAEQLGLRLGTASTRKRSLRGTFDKHRADVLAMLESLDIDVRNIADREPPKRFYKTSEKQRQAVERYRRRKRERKLAESNGNDVA